MTTAIIINAHLNAHALIAQGIIELGAILVELPETKAPVAITSKEVSSETLRKLVCDVAESVHSEEELEEFGGIYERPFEVIICDDGTPGIAAHEAFLSQGEVGRQEYELIEAAWWAAEQSESEETSSQPVYFFSRHEAQPEMVADLGGKISAQFRGTIDKVRCEGDAIAFEETIGDTKISHTISADSIVVAVAPLPLQQAWLKAGVAVLLLPQNRREMTPSGEVKFNYSGLLQVHRIEVVTSQWAGAAPTPEQKTKERNAL